MADETKDKGILFDSNLFYERQLLRNSEGTKDAQAKSYTHWTLYTNEDKPKPIISGIIATPEVSFSISHNFSPPDGLTGTAFSAVGGVLNEMDQINQLAASAGSALGTALDVALNEDGAGDSALNTLQNKIDSIVAPYEGVSKFVNTLREFPGSKVVSTLDYTRVFKGTSVQFPIPTLTTRLYHGIQMVGEGDYYNKDNFSIQSQLAVLLKYFMGDDKSPTNENDLNNVIGIQLPPNNFKPSFEGLASGKITEKASDRTKLPGTFYLQYGDVRMDNLLVSNLSVQLSTLNTPVRYSETGEKLDKDPNSGRYLYADVAISVEPCAYIGKTKLISMLNCNNYADKASYEIKSTPYTPVESPDSNTSGKEESKPDTTTLRGKVEAWMPNGPVKSELLNLTDAELEEGFDKAGTQLEAKKAQDKAQLASFMEKYGKESPITTFNTMYNSILSKDRSNLDIENIK